jgi:hypothetical protein
MFSSMNGLRTLTISRCKNLSAFTSSWFGVVSLNLEELILDPRVDGEKFDIQSVTRMAEQRARSGAKLKSVRIVSWDKNVQECVLKLKEHGLHVECSARVALVSDGADSSDEED